MFLTKRYKGFTLAEMLVTVMIVGILASIAVPGYSSYKDKVDIAMALSDIQGIELHIERFRALRQRFPDSLAEINMDGKLDPWGNPYQ